MNRYTGQFIYGRYEIRDSIDDHRICYCDKQEDAKRIIEAMNEQWEIDKIKEK